MFAESSVLRCVHDWPMHEWVPQTPDELRHQAAQCRKLTAHVFDRDLRRHLEEQAAELLIQADALSKSVGTDTGGP